MNPSPTPSETTAGREIVQTRVIHAPRELVFKAWSAPQHVDRWMGPRGFQTKTLSMEFRPGGSWRYTMTHAEHGTFPNLVVYQEIVAPERIVYDHGADDGKDPHFHVTVTFTEEDGKTTLTMRSIFPTVEACEAVKKFGAVEGGRQTLERLAEYVETP